MRQYPTTNRRMTLLDALVLVAATGVMLWMYRDLFDREDIPTSLRTFEDIIGAANWLSSLFPCATAWTMALLVLSLRGPRPPLRKLSRQPGFVALLTASVIILVGIPVGVISECSFYAATGHSIATIDWNDAGLYHLGSLPKMISFAIAAAWIVLAICGRWRANAHWIDRLGRATGVFWISVIPIHELGGVGCLGS